MAIRRAQGWVAVWGMVVCFAGCGVEIPARSGLQSAHDALVVPNGRELNGRELNGVSYSAATVHGLLSTLALEGSELVATSGRSVRRGTGLVGAILFGHTADSFVVLRVEGVGAEGDVFRYQVSAATRTGWQPLCGHDADGNRTAALALAGTWDYRSGAVGGGSHSNDGGNFTFACEGYALAKCVALGYAPWRSVDGRSLADFHQACTRMLRADYCGNGTSYTEDGVLIDVYDDVGLQADTESWAFEAEWVPGGAACLNAPRRAPERAILCAAALRKPGCGDTADFGTGTLLMDESPAR